MPKARIGSLERRAGGGWSARVRMPDGSRPAVALRATNEADARTEALALQAAADRGEPPLPPAPPEPHAGVLTLAGWAEAWVTERCERGLTSAPDDRGRLRRWVLPKLGAVPLADISSEAVRTILTALPHDLSPLTYRQIALTLRCLFKDAVRAGRLPSSPYPADVPKRPRVRKVLQFLFPDDAARLFASPLVPPRRRRLWALLTYTGLRLGELAALTVGDVDTERRFVLVRRAFDKRTKRVKGTKSGEPRYVPLEPAAVPLLCALTSNRDPGAPLVPRWADHPARVLRRDLRAAGVRVLDADAQTKGFRVHDLRATYITWRLARGDAPLFVRDAAGHSSFTTTEEYYRSVATARLGGFFAPLPGDLCLPRAHLPSFGASNDTAGAPPVATCRHEGGTAPADERPRTPPRNVGGRPPKHDPRQLVAQMRPGETVRGAAKRLGVDRNALVRAVARYGKPPSEDD